MASLSLLTYESSTTNGPDRTIAPTPRGLSTIAGKPLPFITISQQVGCGSERVPLRLVDALNARSSQDQPAWSSWDREIVDKVSSDYRIPMGALDRLEQSGYSWLDRFVSGLGGVPEEFAIVHRLRDSVRALATRGRVVLVGHGSVFMTWDMPGAIRIRLVAPLAQRVENLARRMGLPAHVAAKQLRQSQRKWTSYLRRYWPTQNLAPETFAATLNTSVLDEERLVESIVAVAIGDCRSPS